MKLTIEQVTPVHKISPFVKAVLLQKLTVVQLVEHSLS